MSNKIIFPLFHKNKSGGAVQSALRVIDYLSINYEIYIITVADIDTNFLDSINKYHVIKTKSLKGRIDLIKLLNPMVCIEIKKYLKLFNIKSDLIITNDFGSEFLIGNISPNFRRINVAQGGNYKTITGRLLYWRTFKSVDKFVAVSESEKSKLINIGINASRINVILNSFVPSTLISPFTLKKDKVMIACIGYYNHNKNQLLALKSINNLLKEGYDVILNLYGDLTFSDSKYISILKNYINQNNMQDHVFIYGYTQNTKIFTDNQILLSTSKDEGFGNSLLEAAAYKRIIITTNSGGFSALLKNNFDAIVIDDFSDKKLSQSIKMVIEKCDMNETLTRNAFAFYKEEFDHETQMKKYEILVNEIICK
jgi:glycosyltransferase involved in cell wall biosynthesis